MTSEEISKNPLGAISDGGWLREIAYQLAISNERAETKPEVKPEPKKPNHVHRPNDFRRSQ